MKYLLTLLSFFFAFSLIAQSASNDVIDLHNGTRYQGKIIHFEYGKLLTIRLLDGREVTLGSNEVKRIRYAVTEGEQPSSEKTSRALATDKEDWKSAMKISKVKRRFRPSFSLVMNGGRSPENNRFFFQNLEVRLFGFALEGLAAYQLESGLQFGLGLGFDRFNTRRGESALSGIASLQVTPRGKKNNIGFLARLTAGYSQPLKTEKSGALDIDGGFLVHPGMGIRIGKTDEIFYTIDLGYRIVNTSYTFENPRGLETRSNSYRRFSLRVGASL